MDDAEQLAIVADGQRRAAGAGDPVDRRAEFGGRVFGLHARCASGSRRRRPCASARPARSRPEMRVWRRRERLASAADRSARSTPYLLAASATIERPSGVSSASEASSAASASAPRVDARRGDELGGHAVAEGDGAGLVEQQRVDVARRLDRAAGGGEHIEADQPVHAGDADRRQQAADGRRDQADEQRDQHDEVDRSSPE